MIKFFAFSFLFFTLLAFADTGQTRTARILVPGIPSTAQNLSGRYGLAVDSRYVYYSESEIVGNSYHCGLFRVDKVSGKFVDKLIDDTDCVVEQIHLVGDNLYFFGELKNSSGIFSISVSSRKIRKWVDTSHDLHFTLDADYLYWIESDDKTTAQVSKISLSDGKTTNLWKASILTYGALNPIVIDNDFVYWGINYDRPKKGPESKLYRIPKVGGNFGVLVTNRIDDIDSLALDGGFIFWASTSQGGFWPSKISKKPVGGGNTETITLANDTAIVHTSLIVVDHELYFSDANIMNYRQHLIKVHLADNSMTTLAESTLTENPENYRDFQRLLYDGKSWFWFQENKNNDENIVVY